MSIHEQCISFSPQIVQFASNCAIYTQTQVAEYKQLKDTLNRIPSLRKPEQTEQQNVTQVTHFPHGDNPVREKAAGEPREVRGVNWLVFCCWVTFRIKLSSGELLEIFPALPAEQWFSNFSVDQSPQQGC